MIPQFIIDGTIACGKTTLLEHLARLDNVIVQPEPICQWTDTMDKFYTDPFRYAHEVNLMCLRDLALRDSGSSGDSIVVSERSIHASYHVFGKLTLEQGYITSAEFRNLQQEYHACQTSIGSVELVYIFLDIDADVAIERMERRKRSEVLSKDREYFVRLVEVYRRFYQSLESAGANVCRVDGHLSESEVVSQVLDIIIRFAENNYLK